jgi:hypothetical protein
MGEFVYRPLKAKVGKLMGQSRKKWAEFHLLAGAIPVIVFTGAPPSFSRKPLAA